VNSVLSVDNVNVCENLSSGQIFIFARSCFRQHGKT